MMAAILCLLLFVGVLVYIFKPANESFQPIEKSRLAYLLERKEVIYENLRDVNFDYRAGKYPQEDYENLRVSLENEAALVLAEIDRLQGSRAVL